MVLRSLLDFLRAAGVTPVTAVGQTFDPQVHEAVDQVHSPAASAEHRRQRISSRLHDRRSDAAPGASCRGQGPMRRWQRRVA